MFAAPHLVVEGLSFQRGALTGGSVVHFASDHGRLTETAIVDYNLRMPGPGPFTNGANRAVHERPLHWGLKRIAAPKLRGERPDHTLCTTALVHEAWVELARLHRIQWQNRSHYLALAARAMRRVLIDHAVARRALKRGGGSPVETPNDDAMVKVQARAAELLDLDAALMRLGELDERQVQVVECRLHGGMSIEETAEALGVSPATVKRPWALARAWLNRELRG